MAVFVTVPETAPEWASDRGRLWDAVEAAEKRSDANTAREITVALPAELEDAEREALARELAAHLVEEFGVAVDGAVHEPSADGDQRNHHAHLLLTTRRMGADGLGAKTRELNDRKTGPEAIRQLREWWAEACNARLAAAGEAARVDHRSFDARRVGLEAEASAAEAEAARAERPGLVGRLTSSAESRRERAESARGHAEAARSLAELLEAPTRHEGPARTAVRRKEARLEAELKAQQRAEAERLEVEAAAERRRAALEREERLRAVREREEREAALRASQEALRARQRLEGARAWVRETLEAGDERLKPPGFEAFALRCGDDDLLATALAWTEDHEAWFEGLGERLERERPAFEPVGPSLGLPAAGARTRTVEAAAQALFETPAWRAHAAQAVTFSAVQSFGQMHRRPGFEAFREAVERAVQRLRAHIEALRPKPEAKPKAEPEPLAPPSPYGGPRGP